MMSEISNKTVPMLLIMCTVVLNVYSQLVVKWRVKAAGALPNDFENKVLFLIWLWLDPWVMSAILAVLLAGLAWMAALSKLELSYAYPFMSLAFVLVLIGSVFFFREAVTVPRVVGLLLIISGIIVTSRG
jgi:drug/metabolite transporter (DMT)-like permease